MKTIHPAVAEHVIEENERLRGLLRELREITSEYAWDADLEARVDAALSQQAEAAPAQDELWAVHAQGPDELYAAFSREDAEQHAAALNALSMPAGIQVSAIVVESPWPAAEHWKYLAEQEREHAAELKAIAARPAQTEQQPIHVTAVAVTREDPDEGLYLDWLLEGGICELEHPGQVLVLADRPITDDEGHGEVFAAPIAQAEQQPVAWLPYLSDRADGVAGHYAIARKNPAGYREVWNLRCHCWASASDEVLTLDEALAILKKLEMPTAPIAQTEQQPVEWQYRATDGTWWKIEPKFLDDAKRDGLEVRSLYAAPIAQTAAQPEQSGLVEALKRVKLSDEEARRISPSCAAHWNNAVEACIDALSTQGPKP